MNSSTNILVQGLFLFITKSYNQTIEHMIVAIEGCNCVIKWTFFLPEKWSQKMFQLIWWGKK